MRAAVLRALAVAALGVVAPAGAQPAAQAALDSIVPPSPTPAGFIADGGPVLDAAARDRLNARIAAVQRETGGDVAVAIVPDIRGRAPVDVGVAIYRAWGVGRVDSLGSARRDLGALLLIVPKELAPDGRGECWITTGLGAEGELIDAEAGRICRDAVIPRLRERDYAGAVSAGVEGIAAAFVRTTEGLTAPAEVGAARERRRERARNVGLAVGGGLLGTGGLAAGIMGVRARRRRRPRPCPRGHGPMVRLSEVEDDAALTAGQRAEERVKSVDYDVWACQTCDERLVIPYGRWTSYEQCPACGHKTVESRTRTVQPATRRSTGLAEVTLACAHCAWRDVKRRVLPVLPPPSAGGGRSGGGGSSFGGSGRTGGGGGGGSY